MSTSEVQRNRPTLLFPTAPARAASPLNERAARFLGVIGIVGIAFVHILDAGDTYRTTPYLFWLYIALIASVLPVGGALIHVRSPLTWLPVAVLAAAPLMGYLLSRSVGLPGDSVDVGNWLDTLGLASMFVEASVLGLSLSRLILRDRDAREF